MHYGTAGGIFSPQFRNSDLVAQRPEALDALLAIATDLLAQSEAQQRTATRLDTALRQMRQSTRSLRDRAHVTPRIETVRLHVRTLRDLFEAERALLEELEREIAGATAES